MDSVFPNKSWRFPIVLTRHVFLKIRAIDMSLAEFEHVLVGAAAVIESTDLSAGVKELLLLIDWRRPLHAVVVVDEATEEERVITVYEPSRDQWTDDYQRRR